MKNRKIVYAGFVERFHAMIVMFLVIFMAQHSISYFVFDNIMSLSMDYESVEGMVVKYLTPLLLIVPFWIKFAQDKGKMLYKIEIVDATTYEKPTFEQFMMRYAGYYLSSLVFGLGFLWVLWDEKKQGWHDKIANTIVIKTQASFEPEARGKAMLRYFIPIVLLIVSIFATLLWIGTIFSIWDYQ